MAKPPWPYDPRLRELLVAFLKVAKKVRKSYAIGGALAMSAHGYVRQTSDLDAFLLDEDRLDWLRALRKAGLTIDSVFRGIHYIAFFPKHADPRIRIDLLFPATEPELSAVEFPVSAKIAGFNAEVFPLELLVVAKFLSDRPEDQRDFDVMFNLGIFEPTAARRIIKSIEPKKVVATFDQRIKDLSRPRLP